MASNHRLAIGRLNKEAKMMKKSSMDNVIAFPSKENIFIWYFSIFGLDGAYKHGVYMGKILFPPNYPFKPPDIMFITPNGRFYTNKKICMSFTSYHPESWSNWSIEGLLIGLISFFVTDNNTTGAMYSSNLKRRQWALSSLSFNISNEHFKKTFRNYYDKMGITAKNMDHRTRELKKMNKNVAKNNFYLGVGLLCFFILLYFLYKIYKYNFFY